MKKYKIPFIARFAEQQKDNAPSLDTHYDYENDITMIKIKNRYTPLVELNSPIPELLTKTEACRESDDYSANSMEIELQTKTAASRESDESEMRCLELETKTFAERESEDNSYTLALLELYTKTKQETESDDFNINNDITAK
jgi:hypothetical protein